MHSTTHPLPSKYIPICVVVYTRAVRLVLAELSVVEVAVGEAVAALAVLLAARPLANILVARRGQEYPVALQEIAVMMGEVK